MARNAQRRVPTFEFDAEYWVVIASRLLFVRSLAGMCIAQRGHISETEQKIRELECEASDFHHLHAKAYLNGTDLPPD